jgi:hypothetical protein
MISSNSKHGRQTRGQIGYLRANEPLDSEEFDNLIAEGIKGEHVPLRASVWDGIRRRGKKLAKRLGKG